MFQILHVFYFNNLYNMKVINISKIFLKLTFLVTIGDLNVIKCCSKVPDAGKEMSDHEGKYFNYTTFLVGRICQIFIIRIDYKNN